VNPRRLDGFLRARVKLPGNVRNRATTTQSRNNSRSVIGTMRELGQDQADASKRQFPSRSRVSRCGSTTATISSVARAKPKSRQTALGTSTRSAQSCAVGLEDRARPVWTSARAAGRATMRAVLGSKITTRLASDPAPKYPLCVTSTPKISVEWRTAGDLYYFILFQSPLRSSEC
jgi:hypothetical protein